MSVPVRGCCCHRCCQAHSGHANASLLDITDTLERFVAGPATERLRVEIVATAMVQLGRRDGALNYLQAKADRNPTALAMLEQHLAETAGPDA
jgi:hypothetical protein